MEIGNILKTAEVLYFCIKIHVMLLVSVKQHSPWLAGGILMECFNPHFVLDMGRPRTQ